MLGETDAVAFLPMSVNIDFIFNKNHDYHT